LFGLLTRERVLCLAKAFRKLNVKSVLKIVLESLIAFLNPFSLTTVLTGVKIFVHIKEVIK
jgi:hypothetical protein